MSEWLAWAHKHDLSGRRGNGPFSNGYMHGIVLHVNDSPIGSQGTSVDWYASGGGSNEVCPNFQVMRDGSTYQLLPLNWQPWTQRDGNSWGPSIETGGNHAEPLTDAQIRSCAAIVKVYHEQYGVPLQVTDSLDRRGLGTHQMGAQSWGGHPCPGVIRSGQRQEILNLAAGRTTVSTDPFDQLMEQLMSWYKNKTDFENAVAEAAGRGVMSATVPLSGEVNGHKAKPTKLGHLLSVWHGAILRAGK